MQLHLLSRIVRKNHHLIPVNYLLINKTWKVGNYSFREGVRTVLVTQGLLLLNQLYDNLERT
jgi:hypothetical protein